MCDHEKREQNFISKGVANIWLDFGAICTRGHRSHTAVSGLVLQYTRTLFRESVLGV
jgi:hypothetical protein